jgi:hypothetical protein
VTIFIEDYVHTQMSLSKLFTNADLVKYWYPVSNMPTNGKDWPTVTEMVSKNHRLLVFTSDSSKEASEGIAYQWRYFLENECKILSFYLSIFFSVCESVLACLLPVKSCSFRHCPNNSHGNVSIEILCPVIIVLL